MADNFEVFWEAAIEHEGKVNEDVPGDGGGPTRWGITIYDYGEAIGKRVPARGTAAFEKMKADLYALPETWIKNRYRTKYWDGVRADELPAGLDYAVADFGLNSGESRAVKFLQRQMGNPETGRMDDETIRECGEQLADDLIGHYCDARETFLRGIVASNPKQRKFLNGWVRRVDEVRTKALQLSQAAPQPEAIVALPKATVDEKTVDVATVARVAAGSKSVWMQVSAAFAVVTTTLTDWWNGAVDWISSLMGVVPDVKHDVMSAVSTGEQVAGYLKLSASKIVLPLVAVTLLIAAYRHIDYKLNGGSK